MKIIEQSIDVNVPVRTAYNQWTQFEEFPRFMEGVESVKQIDDTTLHWKTEIMGIEREFAAKITEQQPDERIAWNAEGEANQSGVVTFHRVSDGQSRIMLQMGFEPTDFKEKAGEILGFVERRIKGDLERFKGFIEERGTETGAWRGEVPQDATR